MTASTADLIAERDRIVAQAKAYAQRARGLSELGTLQAGVRMALESVTPRVVSTVAELDALPVGTVLRGKDPYNHVFLVEGEVIDGTEVRYNSPTLGEIYQGKTLLRDLPATVLWVGGTE